jgi:DNA-directed RNA polymerase specialized sigma24 family protein
MRRQWDRPPPSGPGPGEGDAFGEVVEPHRGQLLAHRYRVLGSVQDAEDVLQEVLLSAWRALDGFDGRSLPAW